MSTRSDAPAAARRYFSAVEAAGTVPPMASPALGEGRVTRERYWQLVGDGTIGPDDRVELLEGVIVAMSPQSPPHAGVVGKLTHLLAGVIGSRASLRIQLPLDLGETSVPEPDVAVVAGRPEDYTTAHPTTALLVIEVAESSLIQDRLTKAPLYAAAVVSEYWVVNLRDRCVEVHRRPIPGERRYGEFRIAHPGDTLDVAALPAVAIAVAEIFPAN
jgi:Uma2 family endonuclease